MFKGTHKMFYMLLTIACLCNTASAKVDNPKPNLKVQTNVIEKLNEIPKKFKVSERVKYDKVPTRWERS